MRPNAEKQLQFKIEDPGVIAGVDNANIKNIDPYIGFTLKAWHGRALVVIRSAKMTGDIKLTVSSHGFSNEIANITTVKKQNNNTLL